MVLPQIYIDFNEVYNILRPLVLFVGGMSIYAIFIFKFYRFLAAKDIFGINLEKHNHARLRAVRKIITATFYVLKFLIIFPVFAFIWFVVLAALLSFMSSDSTTENIFLVSMAVVGAVRITSYYNEALSTDLSKILPFALLGIFIINNDLLQTVSIEESTQSLRDAATQWGLMVSYLIVIVLLEFTLRITTSLYKAIVSALFGGKSRREEASAIPNAEPMVAQD